MIEVEWGRCTHKMLFPKEKVISFGPGGAMLVREEQCIHVDGHDGLHKTGDNYEWSNSLDVKEN